MHMHDNEHIPTSVPDPCRVFGILEDTQQNFAWFIPEASFATGAAPSLLDTLNQSDTADKSLSEDHMRVAWSSRAVSVDQGPQDEWFSDVSRDLTMPDCVRKPTKSNAQPDQAAWLDVRVDNPQSTTSIARRSGPDIQRIRDRASLNFDYFSADNISLPSWAQTLTESRARCYSISAKPSEKLFVYHGRVRVLNHEVLQSYLANHQMDLYQAMRKEYAVLRIVSRDRGRKTILDKDRHGCLKSVTTKALVLSVDSVFSRPNLPSVSFAQMVAEPRLWNIINQKATAQMKKWADDQSCPLIPCELDVECSEKRKAVHRLRRSRLARESDAVDLHSLADNSISLQQSSSNILPDTSTWTQDRMVAFHQKCISAGEAFRSCVPQTSSQQSGISQGSAPEPSWQLRQEQFVLAVQSSFAVASPVHPHGRGSRELRRHPDVLREYTDLALSLTADSLYQIGDFDYLSTSEDAFSAMIEEGAQQVLRIWSSDPDCRLEEVAL